MFILQRWDFYACTAAYRHLRTAGTFSFPSLTLGLIHSFLTLLSVIWIGLLFSHRYCVMFSAFHAFYNSWTLSESMLTSHICIANGKSNTSVTMVGCSTAQHQTNTLEGKFPHSTCLCAHMECRVYSPGQLSAL